MKDGWAWIFGILTAGGTTIAAIQLATDPNRDGLSFGYGLVVGSVAAGCIAALILHRRTAFPPRPEQTAASEGNQQEAVDLALVRVADLQAQQAHAYAQARAADAQEREALRAGVRIEAARFGGEASQFRIHAEALNDRINVARIEADRIRKITPKEWSRGRR